MKYQFYVNRATYFNNTFELFVVRWPDPEGFVQKQGLSMNGWIDCPEGGAIMPILVGAEDLISLAGELWNNKIKPPEFFNSIGQRDATEKHLSDMRAIAFSKLNIDLPEVK